MKVVKPIKETVTISTTSSPSHTEDPTQWQTPESFQQEPIAASQEMLMEAFVAKLHEESDKLRAKLNGN